MSLKGKIFQKFSIIFICILVISCTFCLNVSAAVDDSNTVYYSVRVNWREPNCYDVAYSDFRVTDGDMNKYDGFTWNTLTANNPQYVTVQEDEVGDDTWYNFLFERTVSGDQYRYLSYMCSEFYIDTTERKSKNFYTVAGSFDFSSAGIDIVAIRFSLRGASDDLSNIGSVVAATNYRGVEPISSNSVMNSYSYDVSTAHFTWLDSVVSTVPDRLVLCVDFMFLPIDTNVPQYAFGLDVADYNIVQLSQVLGSSVSDTGFDSSNLDYFIGCITGGIYKLYDTTFLADYKKLLDSNLGEFSSAAGSLGELSDSLRVGLPEFRDGLANISAVMTHVVGSIPLFDFLVTVSLILGMIGMILGLTGSSIHPKEYRERTRVSSRFGSKKESNTGSGSDTDTRLTKSSD